MKSMNLVFVCFLWLQFCDFNFLTGIVVSWGIVKVWRRIARFWNFELDLNPVLRYCTVIKIHLEIEKKGKRKKGKREVQIQGMWEAGFQLS